MVLLGGLLMAGLYYVCGLLWIKTKPREARNFLYHIYTLSFSIRLSFASIIYVYAQPTKPYYPDGSTYYAKGVQVSERLAQGWFASVFDPKYYDTRHIGFYIFNALHSLINKDHLFPIITNVALSSFVVVLIYSLVRSAYSGRAAKYVSYIMALYPGFVYWSSFNLKESLVSFLIVAAFYCYYRMVNDNTDKRMVYGAYIVLNISLLFITRTYVAFVLVGVLVVHFLSVIMSRRFFAVWKIATIFAMSLLSIFVIVPETVLSFGQNINIEFLVYIFERSTAAVGTTNAAMANVDTSNPLYLLISAFHFLVTPSITRVNFEVYDFLKLASLVWYLFMFLFVCGVWRALYNRDRLLITMLVFIAALIFVYSLNPVLGSARHRIQMMPFVFIICALGWDWGRISKKTKVTLMGMTYFVIVLSLFVLEGFI